MIARSREKIVLKDVDVPTAANPPSGCRFHTRCPYAEDLCGRKEPEMRPYEGRSVACHLLEKLPAWSLQKSDDSLAEEGD